MKRSEFIKSLVAAPAAVATVASSLPVQNISIATIIAVASEGVASALPLPEPDIDYAELSFDLRIQRRKLIDLANKTTGDHFKSLANKVYELDAQLAFIDMQHNAQFHFAGGNYKALKLS